MEGGRRKSWTVSEGWEFGGGRLGVPVMISGKCQRGYLEATTHCPEVGSFQGDWRMRACSRLRGWTGRKICDGGG